MNKLIATIALCAATCGCAMFKTPQEPMPETGTYEYWGKVNGHSVYMLWVDGKAYSEKEAKKHGFEWRPPCEVNAK